MLPSSVLAPQYFLPDRYRYRYRYSVDGLHKEEVVIYIKRIEVTWCWWWYLQRIGMTWCWWWSLLWSWLQARNNFSSYCFHSLILEATKFTSEARKFVLEGVWWRVNEFNEHVSFRGRQRYAVHGVLKMLKSVISHLLNTKLFGGCILCCFLFSPIIPPQSSFR